MNDMIMKKIFTFIIVCLCMCITIQAQDIPIEKFMGVWHASQEPWSSRTMKISQEDGKTILQVKDLISGEATLNGNRLEITVVVEVNYGRFWVGRWDYDSPNDILVGHSDGSYGTDGEVSGFFSESYRHSKANKEVEYISVYVVYKYEGTLELYYSYHSTYYDGNTPLFYQRYSDLEPHIYTNW